MKTVFFVYVSLVGSSVVFVAFKGEFNLHFIKTKFPFYRSNSLVTYNLLLFEKSYLYVIFRWIGKHFNFVRN